MPQAFRSSFRDGAAECSDASREVCELALAHVKSDRVEAAYRRTDLFERRRALMEESVAFLAGPARSSPPVGHPAGVRTGFCVSVRCSRHEEGRPDQPDSKSDASSKAGRTGDRGCFVRGPWRGAGARAAGGAPAVRGFSHRSPQDGRGAEPAHGRAQAAFGEDEWCASAPR